MRGDLNEIIEIKELLSDCIPEITVQLTKTSGIRPSLEKQLLSLFDALDEYSRSQNPSKLDEIIRNWISQYTEAELPQVARDLSSFVHSIEIACIEVIQNKGLEAQEMVDDFSIRIVEWFFPAQLRLVQIVFQEYIERHKKAAVDIQSMLEKLDRSKSNFISIAAHELKTPLTIIEGYWMMLSDALEGNENLNIYQMYLEGIRKGAERLKQIVQDMIDVSLIDARMLLLSFQPCLLNRIIEKVVEDMKRQAADRDLLLQWQPIQGINEMIYLDEVRLTQALRNVVENAIKYTPDGGKIRVYGRKLSGFVEIMVEDTGIGVDPEDQPLIFEKFSQLGQVSLHSTGKSKFKGGGAGLGLPIAKGILEAHGGTIWMESQGYDEIKCPGSIFHLMVPIYTQPPPSSISLLSNQRALYNQHKNG